jgi:hypothetical protein
VLQEEQIANSLLLEAGKFEELHSSNRIKSRLGVKRGISRLGQNEKEVDMHTMSKTNLYMTVIIFI